MQQLRPEPVRIALGPADAFVGLGLAAVIYLAARLAVGAPERFAGPAIVLDPVALPYYALRSLLRMAAAYALSLAFTLVYAYVAAKSRRARSILIPTLDVLQSVPILSLMPAVVLSLVSLLPGAVGVELASIILIFTSQVWNMTFALYNALLTIPVEMREAAEVLRLNWWMRFRHVELPFATIGLVWNSMMSWAGGWFFLMAAEQFVLGDRDFRLPGLGSYLSTAAQAGNIPALVWGLAALITLIIALDQFLWRPLLAWADKFQLQTAAEAGEARSWVLDTLSRSVLIEWLHSRVREPLEETVDGVLGRTSPPSPRPIPDRLGQLLHWAGWLLLAVVVAALLYGASRAAGLITDLSWGDWLRVLAAAGATFGRVLAAQVLALAWTVPVGVAIGTNRRLSSRLVPVVQVAASVPATALFPVLLLLLIGLAGGLNLAAILLMLLGTQWYLLFNIIAGAMAIPEDLKYTTEALGIRGLERWRSFILPAIFPYLVTGMVTATGGAWNASIVSEYVRFGGTTYSTLGLGALIARSSEAADFRLLLASTLMMVAIVVLVNRLFWERLYALAQERFHLE